MAASPRATAAASPSGPADWGHEAQPLFEPGPLQEGDLPGGVLVASLPGQVAEFLVGELAPCVPDDPVLGEHARLREVQEPGQEFARRQITGGPEEDDDVGDQEEHPICPDFPDEEAQFVCRRCSRCARPGDDLAEVERDAGERGGEVPNLVPAGAAQVGEEHVQAWVLLHHGREGERVGPLRRGSRASRV
jgi:hypothetical protein